MTTPNVNTSIISTEAALEILKNIPSMLSMSDLTIYDESNVYASVSLATFNKIATKKTFTALKTKENPQSTILIHESHSRLIKSTKAVVENYLPEGAVVFPEDNFYIIGCYGKDGQKFFKNLVKSMGVSGDFDFEDQSVALKKNDEYFASMYIDSNDPTIVRWFVKPNASKKKYAWTGLSFQEARDKLMALAAKG